MISVQYVGNPEGNHTSRIHLEGRPDLVLGGPPGDVTQTEYNFLTSSGYLLTIVGSGGTDPTPNAGPITLQGGVIVRSFDGVAVPIEGRVSAVERRSPLGEYSTLTVGSNVYAGQLVINAGILNERIADGTISGTFNQANWNPLGGAAVVGGLVFKNTIDCSANPNYPLATKGDTYVISVAGKIGGASGIVVEPNDMALCKADTVAGTQAAVGANWAIVQANIDGAVIGPASAVSGNLATFNGTGGKLIQDAGVAPAAFVQGANNGSEFASKGATRANLAVPDLLPAACVATTAVALTGLQTIDGYILLDGDQALLTAQGTASQNGPWVAHSGAWTRPTDFPTGAVVKARRIQVSGGTVYAGVSWTLRTNSTVTIDTTAQTWTKDYLAPSESDARYIIGSPDPSFVGLTNANTLKARAAAARSRYESFMRVNLLGDSLFQGAPAATNLAPLYQRAVVGQLQAMHAADSPASKGSAVSTGVCIPYANSAYAETDARFTFTGTWTNPVSAGFVLSQAVGTALSSATIKFDPAGSPGLPASGFVDNFNLFFATSGSALGTIQIDAGTPVAFNFSSPVGGGGVVGPGSVYARLAVDTGGAGAHTITIAVTTGTLTLIGIEGTLTALGARITRLARGALTSTNMTSLPLTTIHALMPGDLTILDFGMINDFLNQTNPATTQANATTLITSFLTTGSVIGFVSPFPNDAAATYAYPLYVAAIYAACQAASIPIYDFSLRWSSYSAGSAAGLYYDAHHPSLRGNGDFASQMHGLLRICGLGA